MTKTRLQRTAMFLAPLIHACLTTLAPPAHAQTSEFEGASENVLLTPSSIEAGITADREVDKNGQRTRNAAFPFGNTQAVSRNGTASLRFGVRPDLELGLQLPYRSVGSVNDFPRAVPPFGVSHSELNESGLGDITLYARYAFARLSDSQWIAGLFLKPNSAHGATLGTNDNRVTLSLRHVARPAREWRWFGEYAVTPVDQNRGTFHTGAGGIQYWLSENIRLDTTLSVFHRTAGTTFGRYNGANFLAALAFRAGGGWTVRPYASYGRISNIDVPTTGDVLEAPKSMIFGLGLYKRFE